jgi:hypothetical protein
MQISCDVFSGEQGWRFGIPTGSLASSRKEGNGEKTESHMFISLSIIMMYEQTRLITSIGTPEARAKPTIQCSSIQS